MLDEAHNIIMRLFFNLSILKIGSSLTNQQHESADEEGQEEKHSVDWRNVKLSKGCRHQGEHQLQTCKHEISKSNLHI